MHRLTEIETFVAVVEEGGFSAASRKLGVSKSHVSKQISQLESRLGVQLLNRTTRKVALTDAGAAYVDRATKILADLDEAEEAIVQLNALPRGLLRMSMPMTFGLMYISPLISQLLRQHEHLRVDMDFSDRHVDLLGEGFDLVVRVGELSDSTLVARKLAPVRGMFVASPAFLEKYGTPQTPQDLANLDCLEYAYQSGNHWRLKRGTEVVYVPIKSRVRANNGAALKDAACAGLGIIPLPEFIIHDELRTGKLKVILEDWTEGDRAVWALYPQNRYLSAKVRVCVDYLASHLCKEPWSSH